MKAVNRRKPFINSVYDDNEFDFCFLDLMDCLLTFLLSEGEHKGHAKLNEPGRQEFQRHKSEMQYLCQ